MNLYHILNFFLCSIDKGKLEAKLEKHKKANAKHQKNKDIDCKEKKKLEAEKESLTSQIKNQKV